MKPFQGAWKWLRGGNPLLRSNDHFEANVSPGFRPSLQRPHTRQHFRADPRLDAGFRPSRPDDGVEDARRRVIERIRIVLEQGDVGRGSRSPNRINGTPNWAWASAQFSWFTAKA